MFKFYFFLVLSLINMHFKMISALEHVKYIIYPEDTGETNSKITVVRGVCSAQEIARFAWENCFNVREGCSTVWVGGILCVVPII